MNFIEPISIRTVSPTEQLAERVQLLEEQLLATDRQLYNLTHTFLNLQIGKPYEPEERMRLIEINRELLASIRKRDYSK
jgi:hypothetical protein